VKGTIERTASARRHIHKEKCGKAEDSWSRFMKQHFTKMEMYVVVIMMTNNTIHD
jgi:hypothetical protein